MDKRGWRWPDGRRILDGPGHGPAELDRARLQAGKLAAAQVADGAVTTLTWTADGQLADRVFPDGSRERRAYDAEGNLVAYLSPSGEPTRYEYGPFDRLTVVTGPDGTRTEFRYDHALRLTAVTRAGLTWRYDYDAAGRLVAETDFNGAVTRYAYDPAGQLTSRTNAAGQAVTYAYDELGRLVRRAAGEVVSSFGYDAAGRLIRASSPDAESGSPATRSAASPPKLPRLRTTARTGLIRQAAPGAVLNRWHILGAWPAGRASSCSCMTPPPFTLTSACSPVTCCGRGRSPKGRRLTRASGDWRSRSTIIRWRPASSRAFTTVSGAEPAR
jgi:YD repeat-containing protein